MKIAILGGAGAMGALFGARLKMADEDVTLIDVHNAAVEHINAHGLILEEKSGAQHVLAVRATGDATSAGVQDYVVVFTKCYHTESAIKSALPLIGPDTAVVSLQNGWGNAPRIQAIAGADRVFAGVTYNTGVLLGMGHTQQAGVGATFVGELAGGSSARVSRFAEALRRGGFEVNESANVIEEIWRKLALNVCTLPTAGIPQWEARKLSEHDGAIKLMSALLHEVVVVANQQGIAMDYEERWNAITSLLEKIAPTARGSMVIDMANKRRTEIDVINGAIVEAGQQLGVPTPFNNTMVWMVKSIEETF